MIEHIGMASTMQTKPIQSVKTAEDAKTREISEKEPTAVQADKSHGRDRFERSSEVSYAGSPDDPKAREAFDARRNAAQTIIRAVMTGSSLVRNTYPIRPQSRLTA